MKVLVSKRTGMVALEAGPNFTNRKASSVFGATPDQAAEFIGRGQAAAVPLSKLPGGEEAYTEVSVDAETGTVVKPMDSKVAMDADEIARLKAENSDLKRRLAATKTPVPAK